MAWPSSSWGRRRPMPSASIATPKGRPWVIRLSIEVSRTSTRRDSRMGSARVAPPADRPARVAPPLPGRPQEGVQPPVRVGGALVSHRRIGPRGPDDRPALNVDSRYVRDGQRPGLLDPALDKVLKAI